MALGGRKVQRSGLQDISLERGWRLTARVNEVSSDLYFVTSSLLLLCLNASFVFVALRPEVDNFRRMLRGCDNDVSGGRESLR